MAYPISTFMSNWLNSTYMYLKQSGGGPTYPPKVVTTGPGVLPTGGYSLVEEVGITGIPITRYMSLPLPFNPGATGIPATANSQGEVINEIAKANPTPPVISSNFQRLYGGMMNACIADQLHGHNNPNARSACQTFANIGDVSEMILNPSQKEALGLTPLPEQNAKSVEVQLAEERASLTGQIRSGIQNSITTWKGFAKGGYMFEAVDPSGNTRVAGDPTANNFQSLNDRLKAFIPGMPSIVDLNSPVILIGGAALLLLLLVVIVK